MSRSLFLVTLTLTLLPPGISAQTRPDPRRVTLDEALAEATANSHRLAELQARELAASAVTDQRNAARLPVIEIDGGYQRTNHVDEFGFPQPDGTLEVFYPDVPDNWRGRIDLQWPIYTGGRTQALERAAAAEQSATGKDLESARLDLRLETTRAFWALVTATESVRVVGESVKRVEGQLSDVKARFDAGFLPPNDVATVQTRVSRERTLLIRAANQRDSAAAELARLMGLPVDTPIAAEANLAPSTGPEGGLATFSLQPSRPDREALLFRTRAADERIAVAKAGGLPAVALITGYDYARPNPKIFPREDIWQSSWDVGVNISWTLFNGGRTAAEVAEARHLAQASRQRLAELDTRIALEVRQRRLDVESAGAQIGTAAEAVASAVEAQRVVHERFDAGVATSTDLLDAQQDLLEAELEQTRALAEARLAEARLLHALGAL